MLTKVFVVEPRLLGRRNYFDAFPIGSFDDYIALPTDTVYANMQAEKHSRIRWCRRQRTCTTGVPSQSKAAGGQHLGGAMLIVIMGLKRFKFRSACGTMPQYAAAQPGKQSAALYAVPAPMRSCKCSTLPQPLRGDVRGTGSVYGRACL